MPVFVDERKALNMWVYRLHLSDGQDLYYDDINEARKDRVQYGGVIYDRTGKEIH